MKAIHVCDFMIALTFFLIGGACGQAATDTKWRSYLVDRPIYVEACKNQEITERNARKSVEEARIQTKAVSPSKKSIKK